MKLIKPSLKYKQSFLQAFKEFETSGDIGFWNETGVPKSIDAYIRITEDWERGKKLPDGWIPSSTYWLVDNSEFIGHTNIRHCLTEQLRIEGGHIGYAIRPTRRGQGYGKKILELALKKAIELGIDRALVTCDETNEPSRKIIEGNKGILERTQALGEGKPKKLLYWIDIAER